MLNSMWLPRLWILSFADAANVLLPVLLACVGVGTLAGECEKGWGEEGLCRLTRRVLAGTWVFPTRASRGWGLGLCHRHRFKQGVPSPGR